MNCEREDEKNISRDWITAERLLSARLAAVYFCCPTVFLNQYNVTSSNKANSGGIRSGIDKKQEPSNTSPRAILKSVSESRPVVNPFPVALRISIPVPEKSILIKLFSRLHSNFPAYLPQLLFLLYRWLFVKCNILLCLSTGILRLRCWKVHSRF
jgi:hypothetical protein